METNNGSNKRRKFDFHDLINSGEQTEHNFGLTEFVGKQKPFLGIVKQRFEDFVVHEVDRNGSIVRLETLDKPEDTSVEQQNETVPILNIDELIGVDQQMVDNIKEYAEATTASTATEPVIIPIDDLDKQERTKIHQFIKQKFPTLESQTETKDDKKYIKVVRTNGRGGSRGGRGGGRGGGRSNDRGNDRWSKSKPSYVHFVLYKENMDTAAVVNELSRRLGAPPKIFTFAGNKDKRAITTQLFSAYRTLPHKIWQAANEFNKRSRNHVKIHVGHFRTSQVPLLLGDLSGNHFELVLRNVRLLPSKKVECDSCDEYAPLNTTDQEMKTNVEDALRTVKEVGFINYFGMQRFGSHRMDSHKMGILILRRDFKQLVHQILAEKPIDRRSYNRMNDVSFNEAIRIWRDTGDAALAYKKMNFKYTIEGSLLRALSRVSANDYHGALCFGLIRSSRLLYLHAYQSYIWNRTASFRFREYGLQAVEGDLVYLGPDHDLVDDDCSTTDDNTVSDHSKDSHTDGATVSTELPQSQIKSNIPMDKIVLVTETNRHQFTIYDVVLPIIGGLSKLPTNRTAQFIVDTMKEDGVSIEDFASLSKQWCVNGSYRKLLCKPTDLCWEWTRYTDMNRPLIETDLDRIVKQQQQEYQNENNVASDLTKDEQDNNCTAIDKKEEEGKSWHALKIAVTLPPSSYATMLLREVTKLSSLALQNKPWQQNTHQGVTEEAEESNAADDEMNRCDVNLSVEPIVKQAVAEGLHN